MSKPDEFPGAENAGKEFQTKQEADRKLVAELQAKMSTFMLKRGAEELEKWKQESINVISLKYPDQAERFKYKLYYVLVGGTFPYSEPMDLDFKGKESIQAMVEKLPLE